MRGLTVGMVFSYEPLEQLQRCVQALQAQQARLLTVVGEIDWVLICTPQAHHQDLSFFPGQIIYSDEKNLALNRNKALLQGRQEGFYFIDPDCWVHPETLLILCERLEAQAQDPSIYAAAGPNILFSSNPQRERAFRWLGKLRWLNGGISQVVTHGDERFDWHAPTCNILYFRSRLGEQEFSSRFHRVGEDLEFHYRLRQNQKKILVCSEAYVWHEQPLRLRDYLKKIFFYGVAQTQLLKLHPPSVRNRRLLVLLAGLLWLLLLVGWPTSYALGLLLVGFALLVSEILFYEKEKDFISFMSFYVLTASSYLLGQISGLMIPLPQRKNEPTRRANTENS